jgi:N6-adenosine-specific RNA methylase IME4
LAIAREKAIGRTTKVNFDAEALDKFGLLYIDPPWRFETLVGTPSRAIESHYPTMTLDEICALPVGDIALDDAILFLWVTAPFLESAFEVLKAWGFSYRTCLVWIKHAKGMGYYARGRHELLLLARRGHIRAPQPADRPDSVFEEAVIAEPRGEHSVKPAKVREIIERMYPGLRRIELFARGPVPGWSAWGNQAVPS